MIHKNKNSEKWNGAGLIAPILYAIFTGAYAFTGMVPTNLTLTGVILCELLAIYSLLYDIKNQNV